MMVMASVCCCLFAAASDTGSEMIVFGAQRHSSVTLPADSPVGQASIREHAIAWHPGKARYYLVADVIPLGSPHHPNTYDTELHLWSSEDLADWAYVGLAVPKGTEEQCYDGYGAASPAGMALFDGRLYVPFSARKTAAFTKRGVGLAWSGSDPEVVPWRKTVVPVSDLPGEDDDPAVVVIPGDQRLHLYHRTTGEGGYRVVHTASAMPREPDSWPRATDVTQRPPGVRAQELTGTAVVDGKVHLFVIEQGEGVTGIQIAHLCSETPDEPFLPVHPGKRYLSHQPKDLAFGGHFTPVVKDGRLVAASWTVWQGPGRYGLGLHAAHRDEED